MKQLKRLGLIQISKKDLDQREMNVLFGSGDPGCCVCGCYYYGWADGSSSIDNSGANNTNGLSSPNGGVGDAVKRS